MPLIQVKAIEGVFEADEKRLVIERLTDATSRTAATAFAFANGTEAERRS